MTLSSCQRIKWFAGLALLFFALTVWAQEPSQRGDEWETRQIGPQSWYHRIYRPAGPWAIHVVEFDYRDPNLQLSTVRALENNGARLERTSEMSRRSDREKHRIVAAINGDFFSKSGEPINVQMIDGEILHGPFPRSILAVDESGIPSIAVPSFSGWVETASGARSVIHDVNRSRQQNEMIVYNAHFGASTRTNSFGYEVHVKLVDHPAINQVLRAVVITSNLKNGDLELVNSTYVLSAHGSAATWLQSQIGDGDTLRLWLGIPELAGSVRSAIGGTPRLIRDGQVSIDGEAEKVRKSFVTDRHPRTAVGYDTRTARMYFAVVDGRQPDYSAGMSLQELAELLLELGCREALNLDGGGSSTMVVRGEVANSPSDLLGERPVANSLQLVCLAPTGTIANLQTNPRRLELLVGEQVSFQCTLSDAFFNPLEPAEYFVNWSVDSALGEIDASGFLQAGTQEASGFVRAKFLGIQDSSYVLIRQPKELLFTPAFLRLKLGESQRFEVRVRCSGDKTVLRAPDKFSWQVSPPLGIFQHPGIFTATDTGAAQIEVVFNNLSAPLRRRIPVIVVEN